MTSLKKIYKKLRMLYLLTFKYSISKVGKNFYMGKHNLINCKELIIGDYVFIGNLCHLSVSKLHIGKYVMFASRVSIVGGDHKFDTVGTPIQYTGRSERKGVIIKDDVWVGHGATILDGVCIEEGCVIATGSVVTKSTEPYGIYAGVPAKRIKERFSNSSDNALHSEMIKK